MINLKEIKLVIWDLDDTFWTGTLSENGASPIQENIKLVKDLTNRGIVNSICSKNDYRTVIKELNKPEYQNVLEYFVFPSVDWSPKGNRIKQLISDMNLRPQNVLFIDDNIGNLNEAIFYCPEIKASLPDIINELVQNCPTLGKDDSNHSRLKQYKLLEIKQSESHKFSSNDEFLKSSEIKINICGDCTAKAERILELVNRSNQMNYTKIRLEKPALDDLLANDAFENRYITMRDKFGDYGIVGFYSLNKQTKHLEHFLFSCRILGTGLDQYIYQKLEFPSLNIVGNVSNQLVKRSTVDWISESDELVSRNNKSQKYSILFKGPCDLQSVIPYLDSQNIDTEFIHTNANEPSTISQQCLTHIVQSHKFPKQYCEEILKSAPVLSSMDFDTNIFTKDYDFVFLSTLLEGQIPLYRNKKDGYYICYGNINYPFTDAKSWPHLLNDEQTYEVHFTKALLKKLSTEFEYIGLPTPENVLENILYIRQHLSDKTRLVLILGSETDCNHATTPGLDSVAKSYRAINKLLKERLANYDNIDFVDINDFISSQDDFTDCTNHYVRGVYFKIAQRVNEIINSGDALILNPKFKKRLNRLKRRYVLTRLKRVFAINRRAHYDQKLHDIRTEIDGLTQIIRIADSKNKR